jgi:DNA-binding NtrC family response regulator
MEMHNSSPKSGLLVKGPLAALGGSRVTGSLRDVSSASIPKWSASASIYVVDDDPGLTELYQLLLQGVGYRVRAFSGRAEVLVALKQARRKPELLITDYFNGPMPVDEFIRDCLILHAELRILLASGFNEIDSWLTPATTRWVLRKPFTAEEFRREVNAALAAS